MKIDKTINGRRFFLIKYMPSSEEKLWGFGIAITSAYIEFVVHYGLMTLRFETYGID